MSWNHRVVRLTHDGETQYGIHEVYYGPPGTGWTAEPVAPVAESVEELREVLARMTAALDAEAIDGGQADTRGRSKVDDLDTLALWWATMPRAQREAVQAASPGLAGAMDRLAVASPDDTDAPKVEP